MKRRAFITLLGGVGAAWPLMSGETRTVPIVFVRVADPLINSMASPGGNVTGFNTLEVSIAGKWLQLLKEIAPSVARATCMFNPATAPYKGGSDFLQVTAI